MISVEKHSVKMYGQDFNAVITLNRMRQVMGCNCCGSYMYGTVEFLTLFHSFTLG